VERIFERVVQVPELCRREVTVPKTIERVVTVPAKPHAAHFAASGLPLHECSILVGFLFVQIPVC